MAPPRIVGLAGKAGAGKSLIAKAMEEAWGFESHSFAQLLRDLAAGAYRVNVGDLSRAKAVLRTGGTLNPQMLAAANEVRAKLWAIANGLRAIFPGVNPMVNYALAFADMEIPPRSGQNIPRQVVLEHGPDGDMWRPKVVFDDVRRQDEAAAIRERGGMVVWVSGRSLWGSEVPVTDTNITAGDCDLVLDMNKTVERADRLRERSRRTEADALFAGDALRLLDKAYGFSKALEESGGVPEVEKAAELSALDDCLE